MTRPTVSVVACACCLATVASFLAGCVSISPPAPPPTLARPATPTLPPAASLYTVSRGTVQDIVKARGRVASVREALLSFKFQGWLKAGIKPGQFVQEGDLLAQLDPPRSGGLSLEQAVTDAQYALQSQSIALRRFRTKDVTVASLAAKARENQAKISVQQAQAAYNQIAWRGDVGDSPEAMALSRAVADYEAAQAALEAEIKAETYAKTREVEIRVRRQTCSPGQGAR